MEIRILVASEVRLYRDALQRVLRSAPGISIVGFASSPEEVILHARRLLPAVVVIDMAMVEHFSKVQPIARESQPCGVVLLGIPGVPAEVIACQPSAILGYVTRDGTVSVLIDAIRAMGRGAVTPELHGGGSIDEVHAWGTAMTPSSGCLCTRMLAPNQWRFLIGRPQAGMLSSAVPDVMLRVAAGLHDLQLPAPLARSVLSTAMQQFVDTARPNDANDWLALVRGAATFTRERFEDFVAAAAAVGGPLLPVAPAGTR